MVRECYHYSTVVKKESKKNKKKYSPQSQPLWQPALFTANGLPLGQGEYVHLGAAGQVVGGIGTGVLGAGAGGVLAGTDAGKTWGAEGLGAGDAGA